MSVPRPRASSRSRRAAADRSGRLGALALLLLPGLLWPGTPFADSLESPPAPWATRVSPVPTPDILGADPVAQGNLEASRAAVASRLGEPDIQPATLGRAYGDLGALYHVYGIDRAAEGCYENAMALAPEEFRWPYYAGYLALKSGRLDDALELFAKAASIDPEYPALALRLGQTYLGLSRLDEARPLLEQAARHVGLRAAALYNLGQIDLLERDQDAAVEHFEEALALAPEADRIHYPLAQALRAAGRTEEARAHLALHGKQEPQPEDDLIEELKALERGSRPHFVRAMRAMREGDDEAAIKAFTRGLELEPDNIDARVSFARALYLAGKPDAARRQLLTVLENDPDHPLANFLVGLLYDASGDKDLAISRYRRILKTNPDESGAHFFLANLLFRAGDYEEAAEHYRAAFEASPDAEPAALLRFVAMKRAGASDLELREGLEAMLRRDPNRQLLRYALVRLLAASDDPKVRDGQRALEEAEILAANAPPNLANREAQILARAAAGETGQAAQELSRLAEMAKWYGQWDQLARLNEMEATLEAGEVPGPVWPDSEPLLSPSPTDPRATFSMYPASRAY
ncbi:MAG: tetratricopeptide repeat protein [Chromatiales bacterium]|jgi:tetratricopeptide (TPR) repeat protein